MIINVTDKLVDVWFRDRLSIKIEHTVQKMNSQANIYIFFM